MKEIDVLLEKYSKGELSDEELARLNQLTHRDEVLSAAGTRARQLKHRRRVRTSALASLLAVAAVGTALYLRPAPAAGTNVAVVARTDARKEAKAAVQSPTITTPAAPAIVQPSASRPQRPAQTEQAVPREPAQEPAARTTEQAQDLYESPALPEADAVVACNTHCSPDSVISDIWKFLKA